MRKKYDARKMTELCDTLDHAIERYTAHAEMLENEYEKYNSNNTYRGEAADASKEFVYKGQGKLLKEQLRVLNRLNKKFRETQDAFSSLVDSSPNAKIDTDVIEYDKRYLEQQKESFEEKAWQMERVTREMADKFERFGFLTRVNADRARYGFEDMCGYNGLLNKSLRKFEEFDAEMTAHLKQTGLDRYMYDLETDTKATMNALDGMTVYKPDVKKITVTPIAQMAAKMMYSSGLIPMQQSGQRQTVQKLVMTDKTLPGCNALVANRTREIFLKLCRNVRLGLKNVGGPFGAINAFGKMGNNDFILPFGTFEASKSPVVQKIMCSAFYKDYKIVTKNSLADYVKPLFNVVTKGADTLSDIGQGLDKGLKGGAHKIIDGQSDNILYYRINTGGFIVLFEAGGAIQSYMQTGTFEYAQKNAIENFKAFEKGGTDCIIDMVTGLFSLPKLIIDDSRNTRPAVKFAEYLKKNGVSNISEDIAKFCNETKESAKAIGGELDQKVADMEVKDWYQAAGYITVFVASFFTGGKAVKGAKAGEAGEAAGAAEGLSKVEKVTGFADDAARITASGADDAARIASHADDVANLEKVGKAAESAEEVSKLEKNAKTIDKVAEGTEDVTKAANGADAVTYRRVQGGSGNNASQIRIEVNADGTISIPNKDANLSVSIDGGEHAEYFLSKRGGEAQIVEVDVPKWFDDFLQENAIPQVNYKSNPLNQGGAAPKITDITTPGNCYELPAPWVEWLEEYGQNARIIDH
ncbi:MAG: hypothetical protein J5504_11890 [Butyrivibrio sp.]|nr:hypothetical protein [Butyrivibrio sp.]